MRVWKWLAVAVAGTVAAQGTLGANPPARPAQTQAARPAQAQAVRPAQAQPVRSAQTSAVRSAPAPVRQPVVAPVEESATGIGLTAKVGTLGLGADVTVGVNEYLGFRFEVNGFGWSPTWERDEGTINGDFEWLSYGALADLFPAGGGFRVSGGLLLNKNKVKLTADLNEPVELDGTDYALDDLNGEVTFNDIAPYLGIGYGNAVGPGGRLHFACDFGVMFQGEPKIAASARASNPALQGIVDDALANEVADIQDDANAFQFYPVIAAGMSFKF